MIIGTGMHAHMRIRAHTHTFQQVCALEKNFFAIKLIIKKFYGEVLV